MILLHNFSAFMSLKSFSQRVPNFIVALSGFLMLMTVCATPLQAQTMMSTYVNDSLSLTETDIAAIQSDIFINSIESRSEIWHLDLDYPFGQEVETASLSWPELRMIPFNLWMKPVYNNSEIERTATNFDSDTIGLSFGADREQNDWLYGLSGNWLETDSEADDNSSKSDIQSFSLGPYVARKLDYGLKAIGTLSLAVQDIDTTRGNVTGNTESSRISSSAALQGRYWHNRFNYGFNAGYRYSHTSQDGFTESNGSIRPDRETTLGTGHIGAVGGYYWKIKGGDMLHGLMAQAQLNYEHDLVYDQPDDGSSYDDNGFNVKGSIHAITKGPFTLSLDAAMSLARDDRDNANIGFNIRRKF